MANGFTIMPARQYPAKSATCYHDKRRLMRSRSLKGKQYCDITTHNGNNKSHHREKIELSSLRVSLFKGPFTIQSQTLEWPFTFTFPLTTTSVRSNGLGDARFEYQTHPLPPSFAVRTSRGNAGTRYKLKSRCESGSHTKFHKMSKRAHAGD